jgi:6-phosphogluconolactonase
MSKPELVICRDLDELSRKAAEEFVGLAEQSIRQSKRFSVALSGGSTPGRLYRLLAEPAYSERVQWKNVHFFWGDERCVPPDHPESNYGMAHGALLSKIPLPRENVHRMAGEKEPRLAAAEYQNALMAFFAIARGEWPCFNLILLGIGEDGHTASLFPQSTALHNSADLVVSNYVEKFKAHRLTLTLPTINHAANILFLVAGSDKAAIVTETLNRGAASSRLPAAKVDPIDGRLTWLVSQEAAAGLAS